MFLSFDRHLSQWKDMNKIFEITMIFVQYAMDKQNFESVHRFGFIRKYLCLHGYASCWEVSSSGKEFADSR